MLKVYMIMNFYVCIPRIEERLDESLSFDLWMMNHHPLSTDQNKMLYLYELHKADYIDQTLVCLLDQ